jgi:hypothetical protein
VDDDLGNAFLKVCASDLEVVVDVQGPGVDLDDVDLVFFVNRNNDASLCGSQEDDSGLVLGELKPDGEEILDLSYGHAKTAVQGGKLLFHFLVDVSVNVNVLALRTDDHVVIQSDMLDSVLELEHLSSFEAEVVKDVLFYFVSHQLMCFFPVDEEAVVFFLLLVEDLPELDGTAFEVPAEGDVVLGFKFLFDVHPQLLLKEQKSKLFCVVDLDQLAIDVVVEEVLFNPN